MQTIGREPDRERETEQKRDEAGREAVIRRPRWRDSGGQNQNPARQCDFRRAKVFSNLIHEDPRTVRPDRRWPVLQEPISGGSTTGRGGGEVRWPEDAFSGESDLGFLWVVVGGDFR
jgi:hypothetical protein